MIKKSFLASILAVSMLIGLFPSVSFAASGEGTATDPYLVSTVSDLLNIRNDLTACYKLTADIDMNGIAFTPIGNENDGAFSGTLDGAGHKIKNLTAGDENTKYAGLIGFLEGTVKNLALENVNVSGYRYVGGVVGYAEDDSGISDCMVNGRVEGKAQVSTIYVGGIVGFSTTDILDCQNYVCTDISYDGDTKFSSYTGGIVGRQENGSISNCKNKGDISATAHEYYAYIGGISGELSGDSAVENCTNEGKILNKEKRYCTVVAGGIIGNSTESENSTEVKYCCNRGDIILSRFIYEYTYAAGIVGQSKSVISNCLNEGTIIVDSSPPNTANTGGVVGVQYSGKIIECCNTGNVISEGFAGGMVGQQSKGIIENSVNNGTIYSSYEHAGGIAGSSTDKIINCQNSGYIYYLHFGGGISGNSNFDGFENCYVLAETLCQGSNSCFSDNFILSEFQNADSFENWDFENVWQITLGESSGIPTLRNLPKHIVLNECVEVMEVGDSDTLTAKLDGIGVNLSWSSNDDAVATVDANGRITAHGLGCTTVSGVHENGMRANCLIYVYKKANGLSLSEKSIHLEKGKAFALQAKKTPKDANENLRWFSDNESVATVDQNGTVTAVSKGTATITATTVTGNISASCTVQVTSPVQSISLSSTSATLNIDQTKRLTATISPVDYSGMIEWRTTNAKVATVDQEGLITATGSGTAIISVTADSGKTVQCTVTVKSPATDITLNKTELTLEKGYTEKLICSMLPADTTDTVTWSTSSSTYAAVSSDGTVTANRIGTATITATTTSGKKAYCVVTIVDPTIPVASVTVDRTEHIMTQAETVQLKGVILPSDATNKNLTWTSTDNRIASVTENGVVTANSVGVAVITATANNGMYGQCVIKVISASGPSVILSGEAAIPNSTAHVKASIVNNPGISGYAFTINYDESLLTPVSITPNSAFGGSFTTNLNDAERTDLNVIWYSNSDKDIDVNGELFAVEFKVRDTAEYGDYSDISIVYGARDICNTAGEFIALYTQNTTVQVAEPMPGDIYEDGDVNIYDLTLLARYITGLEIFTDRQINAANVTDDEIVDIKDVVTLAQYLVGWSGTELMAADVYLNNNSASPAIKVGSASVNESGEAEIQVSIAGNPGVAGYRFNIDYNAEDIEIISITPSELININNFNTNLGAESESTEGLLVSCYQESNATADGVLFTIKVRYKDPSESLVSPISIREAENNMCGENKEYVVADYETGYVLGDDYIVANTVVEDTNLICELYFDASYQVQSAVALLAFYDNSGRLVQFRKENINIKPGKVELNIDYDKKEYDTYKLMIWEDIKNMKPLVSAKQYGG